MPYANRTDVPAEKTRSDIERVLMKYNCDGFAFARDDRERKQNIAFRRSDRWYRLHVVLPDPAKVGESKFRQEERRRWRVLLLMVKALIEAVDMGLYTFETAFLSQTLLPDGQTAAEWLSPQIRETYETGKMPKMLPFIGSGRDA